MKASNRFIRWSYAAFITCLVATVCDLVSLPVFARLYPAYDPRLQPVSALGASGSPIAHFVSGWWVMLGLVFLLFAYAYGESNFLHHPAQRISAWLIGIYALGEEVGSGLFPGNHLAGHLTATGIIHNSIGGIGTIALVAIPFVLMRRYTRTSHPAFYRFLLIISLTGIFFFLLFSISRLTLPEIHGLSIWHGFWQRLFVANYYGMLVVIAAKQVLDAMNPSDYQY
jgi:small-conductance mechanosensitive channel